MVPGRRICYPCISGGESSIMGFYVGNKKASKTSDCVLNHRSFSYTSAGTAVLFGLGRERRGRGRAERSVLQGAELAGGPIQPHTVSAVWLGALLHPTCVLCPGLPLWTLRLTLSLHGWWDQSLYALYAADPCRARTQTLPKRFKPGPLPKLQRRSSWWLLSPPL